MINFSRNKRILIIIFAALLLSASVIIAADPGSADDPIITLSYFKEQTEILKKEITSTISALEKKIPEATSIEDTPVASFKVVNLKATESLICGEGTELIVRSGQSKAIASESGGLSDVTEGRDIPNNEIIKNNHHLIVPRNDGRGIIAIVDGAIMIKGTYEKK